MNLAVRSSEPPLLDQILAPGGLRTEFQPIVDADGPQPSLQSYECLTRGPLGTNLESADILFEYVRQKRAEQQIDRVCVETALEVGSRMPGLPHFSLNVHAMTLSTDRQFPEFVKTTASRRGISTTRLTVEIVENTATWNEERFLEVLAELRGYGIQIALDDVGLGQSNYKMVVDANPDFLKIDRYFVSDCSSDRKRRAVIQSIIELAHQFEASVIAEGVESERDLAWLRERGIHLFQGYYFSRPLPVEFLMAGSWSPKTEHGGVS
jgi:EAL domain-containing protein (putative c-di-GMP-specific phosphodiesterase class I)